VLLSESELHRHDLRRATGLGVDFLVIYCLTEDLIYHSVKRDGSPIDLEKIVQDSKVTDAEINTVLGLLACSCASNREELFTVAYRIFENIIQYPRHGLLYKDTYPVDKKIHYLNINVPLNLLLCIDEFWTLREDTRTLWTDIAEECVEQILKHFDDKGCLRENILPDGSKDDKTHWGRKVIPGRIFTCVWQLLNFHTKWPGYLPRNIFVQCAKLVEWCFQNAWHIEGGFLHIVDVTTVDRYHRPRVEPEANFKLWWVHAEALSAVSCLVEHAKTDEDIQLWSHRLSDLWNYVKQYFIDRDHGEWHGYLDLSNNNMLHIKGSQNKGCFHIPRALLTTRECLQRHFERKHVSYLYYFCDTRVNIVNKAKVHLAECMSEALEISITEISISFVQQGKHVVAKFFVPPTEDVLNEINDPNFLVKLQALMNENANVRKVIPHQEYEQIAICITQVNPELGESEFQKNLAQICGVPIGLIQIQSFVPIPGGVVLHLTTG
jgi:N-acylglucosamine 2-epimerase